MKKRHCSDEPQMFWVYSGSLETVWLSIPGIRTFQILIELKLVSTFDPGSVINNNIFLCFTLQDLTKKQVLISCDDVSPHFRDRKQH